MELTQDRLKELLSYDPQTGAFTWLVRRGMALAGSIAGNANQTGYIHIYVDNRPYKAHRLAWLYMHGMFPPRFLDHINGDRADNRIANLREVSHALNMQNQNRARSDSASGTLGTYFFHGKWRACIRTNGKNRHLGSFGTVEEAHKAYLAAKRIEHGTCAI